MTDTRDILIRALAILLTACALPQAARACTDGNAMRYYFSAEPPARTPDIMFVQVTIVSKTWTSVEARLEGPFARLSADGMIHIMLAIAPEGTNCVDWGTLDGPVYVVASESRIRNGQALIMAEPVKPRALTGGLELRRRQVLQGLRRDARVTYPAYVAGQH